MKKFVSLFTTLSIVFSMLGTFTVFADDMAADLEISTLAELEEFRDDVNNGNTYDGKTVKLIADIDMSEKYGVGKESWIPIGIQSWENDINNTFLGIFDGDDHAINGLYVYTEEDHGNASFFYSISGAVKNLNIKGTAIANCRTGVGTATGIAGRLDENAQMLNCSFEGTVKNPNYSAGGLVETNMGLISNCRFKGKVEGMHLVGGIASTGDGTIINCVNEGEITGTHPVGGIAGWGQTIKNCINKGSVTGRTFVFTNPYDGEEYRDESSSVGGIAGIVDNGTAIENCYNTGIVSGNNEVGGILGVANVPWEGENILQVKNCYSIGEITSTMEKQDSEHNIGAIIGSREYNYTEDGENFTKRLTSEAVNCYYLTGTADKGCGGIASDTATALTTEYFADEASFANWDFPAWFNSNAVWEMNKTLGRPILQSNREAYIPHEIDNVNDFVAFRNAVNNGYSYEGETVTLNDDIDLSTVCGANINGEESSWEPIGKFDWEYEANHLPFSGILDGKGHTISNLYINISQNTGEQEKGYGLFGYADGTIKNLNVKGSINSLNFSVGGIAAVIGEHGIFDNCSFDGTITGVLYMGGIACDVYGVVSNCRSYGTITGVHRLGGIASDIIGGTVRNCLNESEVTGTWTVGGIAGANSGAIESCVNNGNINGVSNSDEPTETGIGGIAGALGGYGNRISIINSYNTGNVSGVDKVGGITGELDGSPSPLYPMTYVIENCYNIGSITSISETDSNIGCIVGEINSEYPPEGDITNCYYLNTCISGEQSQATVLTAEQFADKSNFADWDFETVWEMNKTLNRPILQSNPERYAPHEIDNINDLIAFRNAVNSGHSYEGETVTLDADIDMSERYGEDKESWMPIGLSSVVDVTEHTPFMGIFNGNGHTISNLYVYLDSNIGHDENAITAGLFGYNGGTIKNLNVSGSIISNYYDCAGGIAGNNAGVIEKCSYSGYIESRAHMGGIAGCNDGTITDCYNAAEVVTAEHCGGGIVGTNLGGTILRCYNAGHLTRGEEAWSDYFGSITSGGIVTDCYYLEGTYDIGVYFNANEGEGTDTTVALTAEQFADEASFVNWDFENVWIMDANLGRPVLRSNIEEPPAHTHDMSVECGDENAIAFDKALTSDADGNLLIDGVILESAFTYLDIPAGNYYLEDNVTLNTDIKINSDVNLCLNGKTLDLGNKCIEISKSYHNEKKSLNLCDCGENGTITSQYSINSINCAVIQSQCEFSMYGGKIINTANKTAGHYTNVVSIAPLNSQVTGTVRLYGGEIISLNDTALVISGGDAAQTVISGSPKIKGKSSDIEINNYNKCKGIIFDAPLTVTEPYRITFKSSNPFTTGWNTYMKDKNISDYFICAKKGLYINKNADGELESYEYGITEQPSADNSYTISVSGEPVSYQWYPSSVITEAVTDQNATCSGSIYDSETKVWTGIRDYFKIDLLMGDSLKITPRLLSSSAQVAMICDGKIVDAVKSNGEYILTADRSGEYLFYTLMSLDMDMIGTSYASFTAEVTKKVLGEAVSGQTSNQFTGGEGKYICNVTYADGTSLISDVVNIASAHIHSLVHHEAVSATCTEMGNREYWQCSVCSNVFEDEEATREIDGIPSIDIDSAAHNWGEWNIITEPTFALTGKAEHICGNNNTHKALAVLPVLSDKTVWEVGLRVEPTEIFDGFIQYISQYGAVSRTIHALTDKHFLIEYYNGKAVVSSRDKGKYSVIFAEYDTDGVLTGVDFKDIIFETAGVQDVMSEQFIVNNENVVKVMLWDSTEGMNPLAKYEPEIFKEN